MHFFNRVTFPEGGGIFPFIFRRVHPEKLRKLLPEILDVIKSGRESGFTYIVICAD